MGEFRRREGGKAGDTQIIRTVLNGNESEGIHQSWNDLSESTRRELLRKHHNEIALEMIIGSVRTANPLIGTHWPENLSANYVAAIAKAHTLSVDSAEYRSLTEDGPDIRMALLSGIFRVADILDESRGRANLRKASTLDLDIAAQIHWWRHYYIEDVTFDSMNRTIYVWFDFPTDRAKEYSEIVPELQVPFIKEEFARHQAVFNRYGLVWALGTKVQPKPISTVDEMPDSVLVAMLKQLHEQRQFDHERRRQITSDSFRNACPYIYRRFDQLDDTKESMALADYVSQRYQLACELWDFGGKRSAWQSFLSIFDRDGTALPEDKRLEIGLGLASMMLRDEASDEAVRVTDSILGIVNRISNDTLQKRQYDFWKLRSESLIQVYAYPEAVKALKQAISLAPNENLRVELEGKLAEIHCLQGEISSALLVFDIREETQND